MSRTRVALLALALVAAVYPLAVLQTPPGFYEGFCPPVDYPFLKPPSGLTTSQPPAGGHTRPTANRADAPPVYPLTG